MTNERRHALLEIPGAGTLLVLDLQVFDNPQPSPEARKAMRALGEYRARQAREAIRRTAAHPPLEQAAPFRPATAEERRQQRHAEQMRKAADAFRAKKGSQMDKLRAVRIACVVGYQESVQLVRDAKEAGLL